MELGGFLTFGNGLDYENSNSAFVVFSHFSQPSLLTSTANTLWAEVHAGPHGNCRFQATASTIALDCEPEEFVCPEACIPGNYRCDFWHDCDNGEDEFECGHNELVNNRLLGLMDMLGFNSPNFPDAYNPYQEFIFWSFDATAVDGDYVVKFVFHPFNISPTSYVLFGNGLDISNQTSYFALYNARTDLYVTYSQEKTVWVEFYTGYDVSATGFNATAELFLRSDIPEVHCDRDQFACSDGRTCIPGNWQCDQIHDCPMADDEDSCDECTEFQFECPEKCISADFECDFFHDCDNGEDEIECGHPTGERITVPVDANVAFTSPGYPNPYPINGTVYIYTFETTDPAHHLLFTFNDFTLSDFAFVLLGSGFDISNQSSSVALHTSRYPPTDPIYIPSDKAWVYFSPSDEAATGFSAEVTTYQAGAIPPVSCGADEWACVDGRTCILESARCDGYHDCPASGEDEHGCPSACRELEFECRNGECLSIHAHCNGVGQCSENEDELGCGYNGTCNDFQFKCRDGTCIPSQQRCNYFYDCPDGSDEAQAECGQCNTMEEYMCEFGNCIPNYWQCDYYYDCANGDDEIACGDMHVAVTHDLAMGESVNLTSMNWPDSAPPVIYQLWHLTAPEGAVIHFDFLDFDLGLQSFVVFSDGHNVSDHSQEWAVYYYRFNPGVLLSHTNEISVQYYSGAYVGTRGIYLSAIAVAPHGHGHVHTPCDATAFTCAEDLECIPAYWECDGFVDCVAANDEVNCTYTDTDECGRYSDEYQCEGTDICIHAAFKCDHYSDCPNHDDEFNCTCTENDFLCESTGQCIPRHQVCDYHYHCIGSQEDEQECGEPSDTSVIDLPVGENRFITSPSYPNDYASQTYVVFTVTAPEGYIVWVRFEDFDIDWQGFLVFGSGLDYSDHDQTFAVFDHHDDPSYVYSPTNVMFALFHGGPYGQSRGFNLTLSALPESDSPTDPPQDQCEEDEFQCLDGSCIVGYWECDGIYDCSQDEDEAKCYASGGSCRPHQFTCNTGDCIHDSWRCDGYFDCLGHEDEEDCSFSCSVDEFSCPVSEECVPLSFECDYIADCTFGEDEISCGPCEEGYFNCSDGACVPHYYVCDGYNDCPTNTDELDCGTPNNTEQITLAENEVQTIQSPGYPLGHETFCYNLWIVTAPEGLYVHIVFNDFSVSIHTYLSFGVGDDPDNSSSRYAIYYHRTAPRELVVPSNVAWVDYHCGHYADGRGFEATLTTTDISTHVFPPCEEGEVQCYDGHCIPSHFLCDTVKDCSMGEDEGNLGLTDCDNTLYGLCGTHETEYQCGQTELCIHADFLCDQIYDCPFGDDELNCQRECTEFEFECPGQQCIPLTQKCNFFLNCVEGVSDEDDCGTPENSEYYYVYQNSTNLTSPNYPAYYPPNDYTVRYISTEPGYVIRATFNDFELSLNSYLAFGNGDNITDFSQLFESFTHKTALPTELRSAGNQMYIEFHSGVYGGSRGFSIHIDAVESSEIDSTCSPDQFQCVADKACIPWDFVCDFYPDCGDNSDEEQCQGTCHDSQFVCDDGQCIPGSWECDAYADCFGGEDEQGCDFECTSDEFKCETNGQCIPGIWQCDYYPDCTFGEDETSCGECGDGFFNCTDGACVPDYYKCDAFDDCITKADEQNCGHANNTENITLSVGEEQSIQSPGYPTLDDHESLCYAQWLVTLPPGYALHVRFTDFSVPLLATLSLGTGTDPDDESTLYATYSHRTNPREAVIPGEMLWIKYYCGLYGKDRGFDITLSPTDPNTHVYANCTSDEFQCNDGHCIPTHYLCDTQKDCSMAEDEEHALGRVSCSSFDHNACGTHPTEYECDAFGCVHSDFRCDGIFDCLFGEDEQNCPACAENEFQCSGAQCIHENQRCDFFLDCLIGDDDERNCGTPENSGSIYIYQNMTNISSVNYPGDYPKNEYTITYITTEPDMLLQLTLYDVDLSISTFLAFGAGSDSQNFDSLFDVYTHGTSLPASILSPTNETFIEFHTGLFSGSRGYLIGVEAVEDTRPTFAPCSDPEDFQCSSDGVCIPQVYECDGVPDCSLAEDEWYCQAPENGTCAPHLFTCNDGSCIHGAYRCDHYPDCLDNSDEDGCPFTCHINDFACNRSEECVSSGSRCNYIADCTMGEDEEDCGECPDGFSTCSNGGCLPTYYICDGLEDCADGGDEKNCSNSGTTMDYTLTAGQVTTVTSPNFPDPYPTNTYASWTFTGPDGGYIQLRFRTFDLGLLSFLSVGMGADINNHSSVVADYHFRHHPRVRVVASNEAWVEFHAGSIGGGRGVEIEVSVVDPATHVYADCEVGEFRCDDQSCIATFELCDGQKDCPLGEDESQNCTGFNGYACGTYESEYQCDGGFWCIHGNYLCDSFADCPYGDDELNCTCHTGEFECEQQQCIPGSYRCDGSTDCFYSNTDELQCGHANNTDNITLGQDDAVNITSPGYPADYPENDYMLTYVTVPEGYVVQARILDLELSLSTLLIFNDGHATDSSSIITGMLAHTSNITTGETTVTSFGSRMSIELHTGLHGQARGFLIELTAVEYTIPTCPSDQFTCLNGDCISYNNVCDFFWECLYGDDEAESVCNPTDGVCQGSLFQCNDGECISPSWQCDSFPDCAGGEDEDGC